MQITSSLTALILTFNEEKHIERCITSIKKVTNNIIVVDSFSTDRTVEIAKQLGAMVYCNQWYNSYAKQFNWGLENCDIRTPWVFRIDADEYVTEELAVELSTQIPNLNNGITGIYLKREIKFFDKKIRFGGKGSEYHLKVFKHGAGYCEQRWMDEHIKLKSGVSIKISSSIIDDNKNNLSWWTLKHNGYAIREAVDLLNILYNFSTNNEIHPNLFGKQEEKKRFFKVVYAKLPIFVRPFLYFIYRYFYKAGFLDGKRGLIYCFLQAFWYRFLVDTYLFEIRQKAGKDKILIMNYLANEYKIVFNI